ncbi:LAMI_0H10880g1_1 [Lachancea mirantina]|uniref:LAMI_0H10880g1_1 n=1 Tax=Lachancea mirantina TaxID=1230905 RepID=A0A1G4KGX3_9SACH|nr:LAMI_0H10880g1_1 [Lachancea mirantina]
MNMIDSEAPIARYLTPDLVQLILPYLSSRDLRNLSQTNRYFHKLLDFKASNILWHELFHKAFSLSMCDEEPLTTSLNQGFLGCSEAIMRTRFADLDWAELYQMRAQRFEFYSWGCIKHARLGFTPNSLDSIPEGSLNSGGIRLQFGFNRPIKVPWPESDSPGTQNSIVHVSAGGFSFNILTKSGKLYTTGTTYSGGHRGPGPANGQSDYSLFAEEVRDAEQSFRRNLNPIAVSGNLMPINLTGTMPRGFQSPSRNLETPHADIYAQLSELEKANELLPGNDHVRRLFPADAINLYQKEFSGGVLDLNRLNSVKLISVSSGRSHILALSDENKLYSWDGPEVEHGVRIEFHELDGSAHRPIMKIGSGWNYNCVLVYGVGLLVWSSREPTRKGDCSAYANYKIIPGTENIGGDERIVDFACCTDGCVLYINAKGEVLYLYANEHVTAFKPPVEGKMVKIVGKYETLVIFTELGCYSLKIHAGHVIENSIVALDTDDIEGRFVSIATGDYHTIGLTSQGKIYTWGLESELCGCLGLGSGQDIVERRQLGRFESSRSIRVTKPAPVEMDCNYTCVAVSAGGWQSGALIMRH